MTVIVNFHVRVLSLMILFVMLVFVERHINYLILSLLVNHCFHYLLCFLMCGALPLTRLRTRNIMWVSLIISINLPRFISCVTDLKFLNSSKNFRHLLNSCLIEKFFLCKRIGLVPTLISRIRRWNKNTDILLTCGLLSLPTHQCHLSIRIKRFLPLPIS
jgi:hypothetical protein